MMLTMIAPTNAETKLAATIPEPSRLSESELASWSMRPFTISWKSPSVMMVSGSASTVMMGFTSELTSERKSPVNM